MRLGFFHWRQRPESAAICFLFRNAVVCSSKFYFFKQKYPSAAKANFKKICFFLFMQKCHRLLKQFQFFNAGLPYLRPGREINIILAESVASLCAEIISIFPWHVEPWMGLCKFLIIFQKEKLKLEISQELWKIYSSLLKKVELWKY